MSTTASTVIRDAIHAQGMSVSGAATITGMNPSSLLNKLAGRTKWTAPDIDELAIPLALTRKQVLDIWFPDLPETAAAGENFPPAGGNPPSREGSDRPGERNYFLPPAGTSPQ